MKENLAVDKGKVLNFLEERKKRVRNDNNSVKIFERQNLPGVIDLSEEKTIRGIYDDDEALRNYWNSRVIRRMILDGVRIPSYGEFCESMENGVFNLRESMTLRGELFLNGPMNMRLSDGSLVKFDYNRKNLDNFTIVPFAGLDDY